MVKAGLILEGGGMRGAYTSGVLDCLIDEGIYIKNIYAVSAGACNACSYISKQKNRNIRTMTDYLDDKRYGSFENLLLKKEYLSTKFIYDDIPNKLIPFDYHTFKNSKMNLYAVVTNCNTGKAEYFHVKDLKQDMDIIKASAAIPSISKMVTINNKPYLDGGISDSIPLLKSIQDGNKKNIVVLTQHRGYQKKKTKMSIIISFIYNKYPNVAKSFSNRHTNYNKTLDLIYKLEQEGKILVIQPSKQVNVKRLEKDKNKLWELYLNGYNDTKKQIVKIEQYLEVKKRYKLKNLINKFLNKTIKRSKTPKQ